MTILLILLALIALAALSGPLGTDSRNLNDHAFDRDSLWARRPTQFR